jgi:adenylate kinase family enzyme
MKDLSKSKIALMGVAGTGKTTLAKELAESFGLTVLPENFSSVISSLYAIGKVPKEEALSKVKEFVETSLAWLQARAKQMQETEGFVADRTALDILEIYLGSRIGRSDNAFTAKLIKECQRQMDSHDLIVVLPIDMFSFETDKNEDGLKRRNNLADKVASQATKIGLLNLVCSARKIYVPNGPLPSAQKLNLIRKSLPQRQG